MGYMFKVNLDQANLDINNLEKYSSGLCNFDFAFTFSKNVISVQEPEIMLHLYNPLYSFILPGLAKFEKKLGFYRTWKRYVTKMITFR